MRGPLAAMWVKAAFVWMGVAALCQGAATATTVGGLIDHVGKGPALVVLCDRADSDWEAVKALVAETQWTMLCCGRQSAGVDRLRHWAWEEDLLGRRIYVIDGGPTLWLASDMADAVWVADGLEGGPSEQEVLRVLHPGAVAVFQGRVLTKPPVAGTDQWTHPYHGPDNNVVSRDQVARLPGELRFQTYPVFAPMPDQTLVAGGRIFFFSGHIAFHRREEPLLNTLTVLNAYNGLHLWNRPLDPRYVVHNLVKVATEDEVVFAEGGTLWALDAATGRQRRRLAAPAEAVAAGDTDWKWIARRGDMFWAALGPPDAHVTPHRQKRLMGHWPWNVANQQYRPIVENFGSARRLVAFQYPEMKLLWQVAEEEPFDARTLCLTEGRIFQLAPGRYAAARDAATGQQLWRQTPQTAPKLFGAIGTALKRQGWGLGWATYCCARAGAGVVCVAGPPFTRTVGLSLADGRLLWALDTPSPHVFFLGDVLYLVPRVASPKAVCRKIEPQTGRVLDEFPLGVIGSCTRLTATPSQFFYRPGGGEGRTVYGVFARRSLADYEGIVRPSCFDGVMPAHGRLYWMPLACDCWQVHGTFCMAPRKALRQSQQPAEPWREPSAARPAAPDDWPMFRADPAGTATVPVSLGRRAGVLWQRRLPGGELTPPIMAAGGVFVGSADGSLWALDAATGRTRWLASTPAAVIGAAAYWNGRVVFGSCDGSLYGHDAATGKRLGQRQLAPNKRWVNIMNRFMSPWPVAAGVLVTGEGVAYVAAGSTAADGTVAAAVELATGTCRWRQAFTPDRDEPELSFGVQSNILLADGRLYINGGAPVGIVAVDAETGSNPEVVARLEAGMEMFLQPDGKPTCTGCEMFSRGRTRTTIFKRHVGRIYFRAGPLHLALIDGRVVASRNERALDGLVELMNRDPRTGGRMGGNTVPRSPMQLPLGEKIAWATDGADVRGLAVARDGVVLVRGNSLEAVSLDGQTLWEIPLPDPAVPWGIALGGGHCVLTLIDGRVLCVAHGVR
ncbi:MAG TPA: hypothetical protein EYH34_02720 [Planctomycetes bacterium]|nr:hypothetical protein [Planctomycetota bacterium]